MHFCKFESTGGGTRGGGASHGLKKGLGGRMRGVMGVGELLEAELLLGCDCLLLRTLAARAKRDPEIGEIKQVGRRVVQA